MRVRTAVILAAGLGSRLGERGVDQPKGFLKLGQRPIIEESLAKLFMASIEEVVIVTGHCSRYYEELATRTNLGSVRIAHNPLYASSGSMYSLYCARTQIDGAFLLLESDLIFEQAALTETLACPEENCVLTSGFTGSGDEVYIDADGGRLLRMSKNRNELQNIVGELVGVSKISPELFAEMIADAERAFASDLKYDYETDCLVAAARRVPVHCHLVEDLAWAEIDDSLHWQRAQTQVYPEILRRDAGRLVPAGERTG